MKVSKLGVVSLLSVILLTGIAFAQPLFGGGGGPPHGPRHFRELMKGLIAEALDLTSAQKLQIQSVVSSFRPQFRSHREKIGDAHKELRKAIHAEQYDEAKVRAASKALAAEKEEIDVLRAQMSNQIRPILNEEQLAKVKRFMERAPNPPEFAGEDDEV